MVNPSADTHTCHNEIDENCWQDWVVDLENAKNIFRKPDVNYTYIYIVHRHLVNNKFTDNGISLIMLIKRGPEAVSFIVGKQGR